MDHFKKITESDILQFLGAAKQWMTNRRLTADVVIGGGCALILQTYFRTEAEDMDIWFHKVTHQNRRELKPQEQKDIYNRFRQDMIGSQRIWIDNDYGQLDELHSKRISTREYKPYINSFVDADGYGIKVLLMPLDRLLGLKASNSRSKDADDIYALIPNPDHNALMM